MLENHTKREEKEERERRERGERESEPEVNRVSSLLFLAKPEVNHVSFYPFFHVKTRFRLGVISSTCCAFISG